MSVRDQELLARRADEGLALANEQEREAVRLQLAKEQLWLRNARRFETIQDILTAKSHGELVAVEEGPFFRRTVTLREEKNYNKFPPFLKPRAADTLQQVGQVAHRRMREYGVQNSDNIRFAITSMVRSVERQAELYAQDGKLAAPPDESGHPTGWDVDVDSSSYYLWEDGAWLSVSRRNPIRQREIGKAREAYLGGIAATPIAGSDRYDSRVRVALHHAVADMFALGALSPVVEFPETTNELLHLGVNPYFDPHSRV